MLSFVIPAYNEAEGIEAFHRTLLLPNIKKLDDKYEIIYINDGSKDKTLDVLTNIASKDTHVKVVNLSRNFGKEIATTSGIFESTGDATIILDADGQHPRNYSVNSSTNGKLEHKLLLACAIKSSTKGLSSASDQNYFIKHSTVPQAPK